MSRQNWILTVDKTTLRKARDEGKLDQFIAEHESDAPGDEAALIATLQSMAGKSKEAPEASTQDHCDD